MKTQLSLCFFIFRRDCHDICKTISAKTRPKVLLNSSDKISNPKMKFDILVVTSFLKRKVCHLVSFSYSSFLYENQENWHEVLHSCFPTMFSINVISNIYCAYNRIQNGFSFQTIAKHFKFLRKVFLVKVLHACLMFQLVFLLFPTFFINK